MKRTLFILFAIISISATAQNAVKDKVTKNVYLIDGFEKDSLNKPVARIIVIHEGISGNYTESIPSQDEGDKKKTANYLLTLPKYKDCELYTYE